jgi:hypothetical protein
MSDTLPSAPTAAPSALLGCLRQIEHGPWHITRLPAGTAGAPLADGAALCAPRPDALALLDAALEWVRAGQCHLHVTRTEPARIQLRLFSSDGTEQVGLELWTEPPPATPVAPLRRRLRMALARAWFTPPATRRMLTFMGCDGCGKTTLSRTMAARRPDIHGVYTGKHLYRKSILYKLLVALVRPLLFQKREKFDDTVAPLAYLLACTRLRLKLLLPRKGKVLIDRSLPDFLMLDRKSDTPRFSSWQWLIRLFGARLAHVHFVVPYDRLLERKREMTRAGHQIYDDAMFHHFTRRTPTDYLVFDNQRPLEESAAALSRILDRLAP